LGQKKKSTRPVIIISELNDNIIGIDLICANKLTYDVHLWQVKFARITNDTISATKQTVLPAMSSLVVYVKFKGKVDGLATYIANNCASRNLMISGMTSIISLNQNNNSKSLLKIALPVRSL